MYKTIFHNVIRIRKSKSALSQSYWIVVILNKRKLKSQKIIERLGFFQYGTKRLFSMNYKRLAFYLNQGVILNKSVKRYIYLGSWLYLK